jgi:hypothetical protein
MSVTLADGVVLTVEIGFSTSAGSGTVPINSTLASITWTDVSSDVRSCSIKRGRSSELDSFTTGSCQIVFANADRKYDPEYASGTYYGKLTPGRPIRIKATPPSGSATGIFFGFVDQWNQQYTNPTDATAIVTASDAFKVMNLITLPSYWEYNTRSLSPTKWYRFDDGSTPSTAFDSINLLSDATWYNSSAALSPGASTSSLVSGDTSVSASFDGSHYVQLPSGVFTYAFGDSNNKTIEFWISTTTTAAGNYGLFNKGEYEFSVTCGLVVDGSGNGTIQAQWGGTPGINSVLAYSSAVKVNDGKPHHVVMTWNRTDNTVSGVWVDGVLTNTYTNLTWTTLVSLSQTFGAPFSRFASATYNFTNYFTGVIDELSFWNSTTLSAAQVAARYAIGKGTYLTGNTASARATSLLTMAGWPSDGSNLSTATSTMQGINTQGKTLLAALKECEAADQGRLFIDGSGRVAFISHDTLATTATYNTSQRTFGDSTGELPFTDIEFVYNDQLVKNRAIAARNNGATATVNDTTSQGQYFIRTDSQTGLINDADQAMTDIANVRLTTYKQPAMRIQTLGLTPRANTTIYTGLIGDEIGTRITVKRRPQSVGSVISKELLIEGVSHDIGPMSWSSTYNLSPAPLAFFVLDSSTFGVLDTNLLGY